MFFNSIILFNVCIYKRKVFGVGVELYKLFAFCRHDQKWEYHRLFAVYTWSVLFRLWQLSARWWLWCRLLLSFRSACVPLYSSAIKTDCIWQLHDTNL